MSKQIRLSFSVDGEEFKFSTDINAEELNIPLSEFIDLYVAPLVAFSKEKYLRKNKIKLPQYHEN